VPTPSASRRVAAARRFLDHVANSKARGDEWLSVGEAVETVELFRLDEKAGDVYITLADISDENEEVMREWVRIQLESIRAQRSPHP
jgi:hypothetical protein